MNLWADAQGTQVWDNQQYVDSSGTTWTESSDKSKIPDLFPVVQTPQPIDPSAVIMGFSIENINGVKTQTWHTRPKTTDEQLSEMRSHIMPILQQSDNTMLRIEEGVALGTTSWTASDVIAWVNYRRALRALVTSNVVQSIPSQPAYPSGT